MVEKGGTCRSIRNCRKICDSLKPVEFDGFRSQAGLNVFTMSPSKWIEGVNAIGIVTKPGRYGGTFAHSDIAFEFASWVSAEFKLYIMKDYQRLEMSICWCFFEKIIDFRRKRTYTHCNRTPRTSHFCDVSHGETFFIWRF